jgi:hypothetical protein
LISRELPERRQQVLGDRQGERGRACDRGTLGGAHAGACGTQFERGSARRRLRDVRAVGCCVGFPVGLVEGRVGFPVGLVEGDQVGVTGLVELKTNFPDYSAGRL